jgi:hypothetical protein
MQSEHMWIVLQEKWRNSKIHRLRKRAKAVENATKISTSFLQFRQSEMKQATIHHSSHTLSACTDHLLSQALQYQSAGVVCCFISACQCVDFENYSLSFFSCTTANFYQFQYNLFSQSPQHITHTVDTARCVISSSDHHDLNLISVSSQQIDDFNLFDCNCNCSD